MFYAHVKLTKIMLQPVVVTQQPHHYLSLKNDISFSEKVGLNAGEYPSLFLNPFCLRLGQLSLSTNNFCMIIFSVYGGLALPLPKELK